MRDAYIQWFYGKIHSFKLADFLGNLIYILQLLRYKIKKISSNDLNHLLTTEKAMELLEKESPCPRICFAENRMIPKDERIQLSVIIPVYNYKQVLKETIDSVMQQETTYKYEVILIDDGSSDGSEKIVDEYARYKNVKVIHQKNAGIAEARNTGINHARGAYLMFVDCDDLLEKNMAQIMLDHTIETKSDITECGFYYFQTRNGEEVRRRIFTFPDKVLNQGDREILKYPGLPWAKIYKRELFENVRFPKGFWFEDTLIHFIIFQKCKKISFLNQCLYGYRVYEHNYTKVQQKSKRSIEHLWIVKYMIKYAQFQKIEINSEMFYETVLRHLGPILCNGTFFLGSKIHKAVFVMASEYLKQIQRPKGIKLNYMYRELEESILLKNYTKWKLVCAFI